MDPTDNGPNEVQKENQAADICMLFETVDDIDERACDKGGLARKRDRHGV